MNIERDIKRISSLIIKDFNGHITEDESVDLQTWRNDESQNLLLFEKLNNNKIGKDEYQRYKFANESDDWSKIINMAKGKKEHRSAWRYAILYAAAAITLAIGCWWLYTSNCKVTVPASQLVAPINTSDFNSYKAILQLPEGKNIGLTTLNHNPRNQKLLQDYGIVRSDSMLSYNNPQSVATIEWHSLFVPRAGHYAITLPDSTQVWLNAETSLKFPTQFDNNERRVILSGGEAYFKVAKDINKPFYVEVEGMTVQVTGTEFNINAYPEAKEIATTLVNGGININSKNKTVSVKPSEQAVFVKSSNQISKSVVDVGLYTSWKNGVYEFSNTDLGALANVMKRWYDVEFVFLSEELKNIRFSGAIVRNKPLSFILDMIKETRMIDYSISGNTIYIRNK